jgi:hypothetical protein
MNQRILRQNQTQYKNIGKYGQYGPAWSFCVDTPENVSDRRLFYPSRYEAMIGYH